MATWLMIGAMLFFSIIHSILARLPVKAWVRAHIGERAHYGFYRIGYMIVSVITFLPVVAVLFFYPGTVIWSVAGGWALALRVLQLIGILGLSVSLMQIELGRFAGLAQLRAYFDGDPLPLPPEPLKIDGVYALVRHPLYFFSLLVLWFTPNMTSTGLVFVIAATAYFLIGSWFEERTMVKLFGKPYKTYQQQVPWMLPFVK